MKMISRNEYDLHKWNKNTSTINLSLESQINKKIASLKLSQGDLQAFLTFKIKYIVFYY